jgi:hypothetical protein
MFCMKPPAMLDYSALALSQEGSDAGGPLKNGRLGREPDAGQYVRHVRITMGSARGCDLRNRSEIASR